MYNIFRGHGGEINHYTSRSAGLRGYLAIYNVYSILYTVCMFKDATRRFCTGGEYTGARVVREAVEFIARTRFC